MTTPEVVRRNIRIRREAMGLTQAACARRARVTPEGWCRWESGTTVIPLERLDPVARVLGTTPADLVTPITPAPPPIEDHPPAAEAA
jgi:transcriptional regulator with XRE-family HTH domain